MEFTVAVILGTVLGIVSGILPGIGAASTLLLFFAALTSMDPLNAMMCYLALVISSQYVASVTAIFTGIPGAESAFPTAKESSNLVALGVTQLAIAQNALASIVGNVLGFSLLLLLLPLATSFSVFFGAFLQLGIIIGSILIVVSTSRQRVIALVSILLAFALMNLGPNQHTFETVNLGFEWLNSGLSWVSLTMGAIIGHASGSMTNYTKVSKVNSPSIGFREAVASMRDKVPSLARGSVIGFFVGLVPGLSYILSSTLCYQIEQKIAISRERSKRFTVLSSLISSDAAHCSGTIAMLLPLLAFGVPITASEGVIYNIITLSITTKELLSGLYDNWLPVMIALVVINIASTFIAWKLGYRLVSILLIPRKYLILLIVAISLASVIYISSMTGSILIPVVTFMVVGLIFHKWKFDPLPFIFGVLIFNLLQSLYFSVGQLYF